MPVRSGPKAGDSPLYIQPRPDSKVLRSVSPPPRFSFARSCCLQLSARLSGINHKTQTALSPVSTPRETWNQVYFWKSGIKCLGPFRARGRFRSNSRVLIKALSLLTWCVLKKTSTGSTCQQSRHMMTFCWFQRENSALYIVAELDAVLRPSVAVPLYLLTCTSRKSLDLEAISDLVPKSRDPQAREPTLISLQLCVLQNTEVRGT